ncbi:uncharacterized protein LOC142985275 [Anticarsia gemmatalis]|uniref:uncharacterized protein LOC142985275 n=1 Tax=Anticarsia gemmatalis TaxID=129554 RepID=UPI003F76D9BE
MSEVATTTPISGTDLSESSIGTVSNYAVCCCCLELLCIKDIWGKYEWMGQTEVYGQMFEECFNLTWPKRETSKDQICEVCITHLRNAMQFKQRVVACQVRLKSNLTMKIADVPNEVKLEEHKNNITNDFDNYNEDYTSDKDGTLSITSLSLPGVTNTTSERSGAGKLPVVKNDATIQSVKAKKDIKKNTSISTIKKNGKSTSCKSKGVAFPAEIKYIKPRRNVCLLLENSTIVPFKSTKGYFNCLYCNKQQVAFDELKSHIDQCHENVNFETILKSITRPHDRIKANVSNITCKICKKKLDTLESLVTHLTDEHNLKFNMNDKKKPADSILPYYLDDGKYKCYICKNEFLFFRTLSVHMNTHSSDHVCDVCGRCFLLADRLRAHIQMHLNEKSTRCDICGKVFRSGQSLRSHIRYTHKKMSFLCAICNESFASSRLRMRHLVEVHKRSLNLTCRLCAKKYNSHISLNSHIRTEHLKVIKEPKHSCGICGMLFKFPSDLTCHMIVHSGEKKFECEHCHKKFARAKTLREHLKIHRNDKRWSCGACGQAFVQKCSLRNHIRVHHADMEGEQLIVYNKPDNK